MNAILIIPDPRHYCVSFLREFVVTQYNAVPPHVQNRAREFFRAMDTDGNGIVDYQEFRSFFHSEGFRDDNSRTLFMFFDRNGDRRLDFWEVMTLYYILKTGIRYYICNNCDACRRQQYLRQQRLNPMQGYHQQMSNAMIMYPSGGSPSQQIISNYQIVIFNESPRLRDNVILRRALRALEVALGVARLSCWSRTLFYHVTELTSMVVEPYC